MVYPWGIYQILLYLIIFMRDGSKISRHASTFDIIFIHRAHLIFDIRQRLLMKQCLYLVIWICSLFNIRLKRKLKIQDQFVFLIVMFHHMQNFYLGDPVLIRSLLWQSFSLVFWHPMNPICQNMDNIWTFRIVHHRF